MLDVEAAWLAGIMDGEGCIYIDRLMPTPANKKKQPVYKLNLSVAMTDERTIRRIAEITGVGCVYKLPTYNPNHSAIYRWQAANQNAAAILPQIAPYLVTKKEQGELGLEFIAIPRWQSRKDLAIQQQREACYWRLKALKPRVRPVRNNERWVPRETLHGQVQSYAADADS